MKVETLKRYIEASTIFNEIEDNYRVDIAVEFKLIRFIFHDLNEEIYREIVIRIKDLRDIACIDILKWYNMMCDFLVVGVVE